MVEKSWIWHAVGSPKPKCQSNDQAISWGKPLDSVNIRKPPNNLRDRTEGPCQTQNQRLMCTALADSGGTQMLQIHTRPGQATAEGAHPFRAKSATSCAKHLLDAVPSKCILPQRQLDKQKLGSWEPQSSYLHQKPPKGSSIDWCKSLVSGRSTDALELQDSKGLKFQ